MKYAVVDIVWCKSHGIEVLPEWRKNKDLTKCIKHIDHLSPFLEEEFPVFESSDPEFIELLASEEWTLPEGVEVNRDFSRLLALDMIDKEATEKINTYNLTASEALQVKDRYPEWETGINVKTGERYRVEDVLWECVKDHLTQENWKPSTATLSLWKIVDAEEHSGTIEDPIPYKQNMALEFNKYYTQDGVLYLCIQAMTPGPYDLKDVPAHAQPIKQ
nr:MAG TPA: Chitin oligosaccharide deacetylase [Caudoviricetes sp.]